MRAIALLAAAALFAAPARAQAFSSATVREFGYCTDITHPTCQVRDWWPRATRLTAVGVEAYWVSSTDGRVCFVTQFQQARATSGRAFECLWRWRQP